MTTPRKLLVDPANECDYHLVSRCVRRSHLCGFDELTRRDFSHRRNWLPERLRLLVPSFAVDLYAYAVMSNHFHLAVRHDPLACRAWDDAEVAARWFDAFPPTVAGEVVEELKLERRELMLGNPDRVARARATLGSLSHFMKHLKQPIARRANLEDGCGGHFFEQRFYSGALLTEEALVAAMAYIDLNPVRAGLARRIEDIRDCSIHERLQTNSAEALEAYLQPVVSGLAPFPEAAARPGPPATGGRRASHPEAADPRAYAGQAPGSAAAAERQEPAAMRPDRDVAAPNPTLRASDGLQQETAEDTRTPASESSGTVARPTDDAPTTSPAENLPPPGVAVADYIGLLRGIAEAELGNAARPSNRVGEWVARTQSLKKRQRAYGTTPALRKWALDRNLQPRESPLPA